MKKIFFYFSYFLLLIVFFLSCTNKRSAKEHLDERVEETRESIDEMGDKVLDAWEDGVDYVKERWDRTRENIEMDGDTLTHSLNEIFQDTQANINEKFE